MADTVSTTYRAMWNGAVIAESDRTILLEGNHYFPRDSVHPEFFQCTTETSECPWKGTALYYDLTVSGETNRGAAWSYPQPSAAAARIKDHIAFWGGVEVKAVNGA